MKSIGIPQSGYNVERNIPRLRGYRYARPWDANRIKSSIRYRISNKLRYDELFSWSEPYGPRVDLLHFFNSVSNTQTPWLTTYEGYLPRWWGPHSRKDPRKGMELMLSNACQGLIGFSQASQVMLERFFVMHQMEDAFPSLLPKLSVLLPPQQLFPPSERTGNIKFAFVGGDFYRKGGLELLRALERIWSKGHSDWQLTLVGKLQAWGDSFSKTTADDQLKAERLLHRLSANINHHNSLPNQAVMELLSECHYLIFPSFQESFGYVTLEAMAHGCVPIVTNVRAMPEVVVNGTNGYLIQHETTAEVGSKIFKASLVDQLESTLLHILTENHNKWGQLSETARKRIQTHHDPNQHQESLRQKYDAILDTY